MILIKIINFIFINISLVASSLFIFSVINKKLNQSFSHILFSVIALYFSLITLITIGLGIFGVINFINVTMLSYAIFLLLIFNEWKRKKMLQPLRELLKTKSEANCNLLLGTAIFAPIGIVFFIRFFTALFQVPLEFDSLVYHLPIVTEWLQTGSIMDIYYTAFSGPLAYYPSNFDLFYLWSILPLNNDFLVNLINFPLFILLTLAIYYTSINFGISRKISLIISSFPLYMPVFLLQAGTIFVDIYFVLTFVLSIYFLQEVAKNRTEKSNSLLFGLVLGLFVGTKYLGLPYGTLPLAVFLLIHLSGKKKNYGAVAVGLFSTFLTGSFFYLRNWVNSGNPLFPVEINLFGKALLQGYPNASDKLVGSSLFENISEIPVMKEFVGAFWTMTDLLGLLVLLSVVVSLLFIATSLIRKNLSKNDLTIATLFFIGCVGYFLLYIKAPYSYRDLIHNIRYAMPFLALGVLNLGFLATRIKKMRLIFYILSAISFIHSLFYLVTSEVFKIKFDLWILSEYKTYLALISIAALCLLIGFISRQKKIFAMTAIILSIIFFSKVFHFSYYEREALVSRLYESWYPNENKYWGIWNSALWLDKNAPKSNVAYSGFHLHYPLFGRNFSRFVDYVNINDCTDCRYIDYKNSPDSIRRDPNYDSWVANLEIKKKNYIVVDVTINPEVKNYELEWIEEKPGKFELVQRYKDTYIYKIK